MDIQREKDNAKNEIIIWIQKIKSNYENTHFSIVKMKHGTQFLFILLTFHLLALKTP